MEQPVAIYSQGQKMLGNLCLPREGAPCIVLSHGLDGSKDGNKWRALADGLYDAGLASLRFNYRGCGKGGDESEGDFEETTLTGRILDYRAALDFLGGVAVDVNRLGIVGSSLGGMVALAARDERINAMVTIAAPARIPHPDERPLGWTKRGIYYELESGGRIKAGFFDDVGRYDICGGVSKIQAPLLIIHGSEDELVPLQEASEIHRCANEPKQLEIVAGADHIFDSPQHIDEVVNLSLKWFLRYL